MTVRAGPLAVALLATGAILLVSVFDGNATVRWWVVGSYAALVLVAVWLYRRRRLQTRHRPPAGG